MAHYNVFREGNRFVRSVDAFSSFDARKIAATFNGGSVADFYAIRDNLMTDRDRARMEGQTGRAAVVKAMVDSGHLVIVDCRKPRAE